MASAARAGSSQRARSGQLQRVGGEGEEGDGLPREVTGGPGRGQCLLVQLEAGPGV